MKNYNQLLQFYNESLFSKAQELEQERQEIIKFQYFVVATMAVLSLGLILLVYFMTDRPDMATFMPLTLILVILWSVLFQMDIHRDSIRVSRYQEAFKQQIIHPLIQAMDDQFIHAPGHCVSYQLVRASAFFPMRVDKFSGNDHVKGRIESVAFQFSDIKLQQKETNSDRVSWNVLFCGTFFVAEFNKHTHGVTVIHPETWQYNAPSYMRSFKMDNPDFNQLFNVYGTDSIEAHYLLTHTMMNRLMELKKLADEDVLITFADGCIYWGIDYGYDPNEAPINIPVSNRVIQYINTLQFMVDVIQELRLNEKLWAKR